MTENKQNFIKNTPEGKLMPESQLDNEKIRNDYHGTSLNMGDFIALMSLEKVLGEELPKIEHRVDWRAFGYILENGYVTQLYLNSKPLKEIPKAMRFFKKLIILDAMNTGLLEVPESICNLRTLQFLHLDDNQISILPESIGNLVNLQELVLRNNLLTDLPESFWNFTKLELLTLSNNHLTIISDQIRHFQKLRGLWLNNNHLRALPESIGTLKNTLEVLDIRHNRISRLPRSLKVLVKITQYDASTWDEKYARYYNTRPLEIIIKENRDPLIFLPKILEKIENDETLNDFELENPHLGDMADKILRKCQECQTTTAKIIQSLILTKFKPSYNPKDINN